MGQQYIKLSRILCLYPEPTTICTLQPKQSRFHFSQEALAVSTTPQEDAIRCGWCPFVLPDNVIEKGQFRLPTNVSELNTVLCGNLIRKVKGLMCGRCTNNTGPSIYSVGSRCVQCSPVNIVYYIL